MKKNTKIISNNTILKGKTSLSILCAMCALVYLFGCGDTTHEAEESPTAHAQDAAEIAHSITSHSPEISQAVDAYAAALDDIDAPAVTHTVEEYARALENQRIVHNILDVLWTNNTTFEIISNQVAHMTADEVLDITEELPYRTVSFTNAKSFALMYLYEYVYATGNASQRMYALNRIRTLINLNGQWLPSEVYSRNTQLMREKRLSENPTEAEKRNYMTLVANLVAHCDLEAIERMFKEQEEGVLNYHESILASGILEKSRGLMYQHKNFDKAEEVLFTAFHDNTYNFRKHVARDEEAIREFIRRNREFIEKNYAMPRFHEENPMNRYNPHK